MTKFAFLKKCHTKIIIVKRNLELNDLVFLYYSAKACPDLFEFIQTHFSIFISLLLEITKTGNDEIVNFKNFRKLLTNKFGAFFEAFWHLIYKREKRNEVTGHMKHAAMAVTCTVVHCIV